jgi:hypothetical protein
MKISDVIDHSNDFKNRTQEYYIDTYTMNTNGVHELAKHALTLRARLIEANARIGTLIEAIKELQATTQENA